MKNVVVWVRGMWSKVAMVGGLALASAGSAVAQTTSAIQTAVDDTTGKIDTVSTVGIKAYGIAAGLALVGVIIAFIRKAKR